MHAVLLNTYATLLNYVIVIVARPTPASWYCNFCICIYILSYVILQIQTIYSTGRSQKLFAEMIILFSMDSLLRRTAVELCHVQRREVES